MEHHRAEEFDDIKHAMQLDFRRALIDDLRNHVGELTQDREKKTKNQLTLFLRTVIIHGRLIIQCLILSPEIREPLGVFKVSVLALHLIRLLCRSQIHHEAFRDLTLARREMKNRDLSFLLGAPFPLTGKGRDRGAREPTKPITPTFVLPRQEEGIRAPSKAA